MREAEIRRIAFEILQQRFPLSKDDGRRLLAILTELLPHL